MATTDPANPIHPLPSPRNRILGLERIPGHALRANDGNWRVHPQAQREALAGVVESIGITDVLIAYKSERNGGALTLLDGHLRREDYGDVAWPVLILDVDDREADALLATHDSMTMMATTAEGDFQRLLERSLAEADEHLKAALLAVAKSQGITVSTGGPLTTDPDRADVALPPADPITQPGDLWILGHHRLVCGDASDPATLDRLLAGEPIACLWTDPPYGVNYVSSAGNRKPIANDAPDDALATFAAMLAAVKPRMLPGCPYYIAHAGGPISIQFGQAITASGLLYHQQLVWVKDTMVLGHSDYHYEHEPVAYGWSPTDEEAGRSTDFEEQHGLLVYGWKQQAGHKRSWYAGRKETSVFYVERPTASKDHPTMKPVALVAQQLRNSTAPDALVLDPFGGSGSTLLACEQLGRRARLLELDPGYCDVIVRRWEDLTGRKAERG